MLDYDAESESDHDHAQFHQFSDKIRNTFDLDESVAVRASEFNCPCKAPFSDNSCRSRSCAKCQALARQPWVEAQQRNLLEPTYWKAHNYAIDFTIVLSS
jgi:hypothetical protein